MGQAVKAPLLRLGSKPTCAILFVLGGDTLWHFFLLGGAGKHFQILVISL